MVGLITRHCHALQIAMPLLPIRSGAGCIARHCHTLARRRLSASGTSLSYSGVLSLSCQVSCVLHSRTHHSTLSHPATSQISLLPIRSLDSQLVMSHLGTEPEMPSSVRQVPVNSRRCHVKCLACRYSASPPRRLLPSQHQRWQVIP